MFIQSVAEATTGTLLQKTHYYPFGMAFADCEGENEQPFKYNGKELDRECGKKTHLIHQQVEWLRS